MTPKLIATLGLVALAVPALAQGEWYEYQDDQAGEWSDAPEDPGQGGYPPYPGERRVDVGVGVAAPGATVSFQIFQDGLAPYGQWMSLPAYGRVWRPAGVAAGWRPYYYGRWEWSDAGWLWASDEPWGWAAYHYGRWAFDPAAGWVWIPGYQWAPAWVTWRTGADAIGWAPLGPGFSVYATNYPAMYRWWTFVPCRRFAGVPVYSVAHTGDLRGIYHATRPAPPLVAMGGARAPAWGGPARSFIEQRVGHAVRPVRVQHVASPAATSGVARAGVVPIYRPDVRFSAAHTGGTPATTASPRRTAAPAGRTPARQWGMEIGRSAAPTPTPTGRSTSTEPARETWRGPPAPRSGHPMTAPQSASRGAVAPAQPGDGGAPRAQGEAFAPAQGGGHASQPRGGEAKHGGGHGAAPAPRQP